ncbi:methyl-accepting chemotaxis protein [Rhodobium gokarnense]|uniref:Methyl-accepting chemotaxis protein n=1 Tax=Rhodobium gokarnense TaxID=364296 RepID=A0ABT3HI83_9HYPH|nr:methyl-accepting chemotaxis protein [Rhodobium gokarnense]MCW2310009.1 methyl-accepting chemotaxis protein [Rhodobium gokarnense]
MLELFRRSPDAASGPIAMAALPDEDAPAKADLIRVLNDLTHGVFNTADDLPGDVGRTVQRLAEFLADDAHDALVRTVSYSMQASDAMAAVSRLTGDIRDINTNSTTMAVAIEEMATSTDQVAQSSSDAAAEAGKVEEGAQGAIAEVERSASAMRDISDQVGSMSDRLHVLEQAAEQINEMTRSIEEISDQTKLLALNATIEAARAGEAGRGFAVVASEVKALSEQTSRTTEQIRARVGTLNEEMTAMSSAVQRSADLVGEGEGTVNTVGARIREMNEEASGVAARMSEIANVLAQQREATAEIAGKVTRIADLTNVARDRAEMVISAVGASEKLIDEQFDHLESHNIPNCVLYRAQSDHVLWKKRLAEMLVGRTSLKAEELSEHHSCRLGRWYDKVSDPKLLAHPSFRALKEPHKAVHSHGKAAAAACARGDKETALAEYEQMDLESQTVVKLLRELTK